MFGKTVLVTGSRMWTDVKKLWDALDEENPDLVVQGGALGADTIAHRWCKKNGKFSLTCYPDWEQGRGAALERNADMIDILLNADEGVVIAAPIPESRGTFHTINLARKAGLKVVDIGANK